jgi:hypothetical protein
MSRRLAAKRGKGLAPTMSKTDDERAKRLAEALRQNLHRRKAQARGSGLAKPAEDDGKPDKNGDEADERP